MASSAPAVNGPSALNPSVTGWSTPCLSRPRGRPPLAFPVGSFIVNRSLRIISLRACEPSSWQRRKPQTLPHVGVEGLGECARWGTGALSPSVLVGTTARTLALGRAVWPQFLEPRDLWQQSLAQPSQAGRRSAGSAVWAVGGRALPACQTRGRSMLKTSWTRCWQRLRSSFASFYTMKPQVVSAQSLYKFSRGEL